MFFSNFNADLKIRFFKNKLEKFWTNIIFWLNSKIKLKKAKKKRGNFEKNFDEKITNTFSRYQGAIWV